MEIGTAILMSTGLAISLIVMNKSGGKSGLSLEQYLFGSIVTISQEQVIALFTIAVIVIVLTLLFYVRCIFLLLMRIRHL